ncbi:MAG: helix-hairpin-helix domain-containing protein [Solirubrobacteraceae bacterium]
MTWMASPSTDTSRVPPPANTVPPGVRNRGRRSFDAWIRRNWWCVLCPLMSFGWLTWVGFAYVGARARMKSWFAFATAYGVLSGVSMGLLTAAGSDTQGAAHSAGILIPMGMMLGGTMHGLGIRSRYEARRAELSDATLEAAERRLSAQRLARKLVSDRPAEARQLGVGRPDLLGSFNAGLVDLNSAPAFVIESVSGIDAPSAARIVETREQIKGQFGSLEDMDLVLDLSAETLAKLRDVAVFVPR